MDKNLLQFLIISVALQTIMGMLLPIAMAGTLSLQDDTASSLKILVSNKQSNAFGNDSGLLTSTQTNNLDLYKGEGTEEEVTVSVVQSAGNVMGLIGQALLIMGQLLFAPLMLTLYLGYLSANNPAVWGVTILVLMWQIATWVVLIKFIRSRGN